MAVRLCSKKLLPMETEGLVVLSGGKDKAGSSSPEYRSIPLHDNL